MSFFIRVRYRHKWTDNSTFVKCETHDDVIELRRLLKRRSKHYTVTRTGDVVSARYAIEDLERAELRKHPQVLKAISAIAA